MAHGATPAPAATLRPLALATLVVVLAGGPHGGAQCTRLSALRQIAPEQQQQKEEDQQRQLQSQPQLQAQLQQQPQGAAGAPRLVPRPGASGLGAGEAVPEPTALRAMGIYGSSAVLLELERRAARHAASSSSAAASGGVFEEVLKLDTLLLAVYLLLFGACCVKVWLQGDEEYAERSEEVRRHRDSLQGTYASALSEVEGILLNMTESSAYLAEWNFEEKRRAFEKFLDRVRDRPDTFAAPATRDALTGPFRDFLALWLSVFEQCSVDPIEEPKRIVSDRDLERCVRVTDLAELMAGRLSRNEVSFIRLWVRKVRRDSWHFDAEGKREAKWLEFGNFGWGIRGKGVLKTSAEEDEQLAEAEGEEEADSLYPIECFCGIFRLTVLSQVHFFMLFTLAMGLFVLILEAGLGSVARAIAVTLAEVCLSVMLFRLHDLDEMARLQHEVHHLRKISEEVEAHHEKMRHFYSRLRLLGYLWRYRTLPCLENLEELHFQLWTTPEEEKVEFLTGVNEAWDNIHRGLGPLDIWMGQSALREDIMQMVMEQMKSCTEFVERHREVKNASAIVTKRLKRAFGCLVVRVLRGQDLTNKGFSMLGDVSNPYVTLSTNPNRGKLKTQTLKKTLNPAWEEEFFFPVEWEDKCLEFHVWSETSMSDDPSLGFHTVAFRSLTPGMWHHRTEHLQSVTKGTEKKSTIEFEVFFADEVRQILLVSSPASSSGQRLSEFLR